MVGICDNEGDELKTIKCSVRTKITIGMAIGGIGCGLFHQVDSCVDYRLHLMSGTISL